MALMSKACPLNRPPFSVEEMIDVLDLVQSDVVSKNTYSRIIKCIQILSNMYTKYIIAHTTVYEPRRYSLTVK